MSPVWALVADLGAAPDLAAQVGPLSRSSRRRIGRIRSPQRARQSVLARQLAALAAAQLLGGDCPAAAVGESADGAGLVIRGARHLGISVAHRRSCVAVAIGPGPLGVDVEYCDRSRNCLAVARLAFSAQEFDWLRAAGGARRAERFYLLWTLREAAFKAGLRPTVLGGEGCLDPRTGRAQFGWGSRSVDRYRVAVATPAPAAVRWLRLAGTGLAPLRDDRPPGFRGRTGATTAG